MRWKRPLVVVGILVALQGLAILVFVRVERARRAAPPATFAYEAMDGPEVDLDFVRPDGVLIRLPGSRDRVVLLHFWATWCPPCREELPTILAAAAALRPVGLDLLAVSVDDDWPVVVKYFDGAIPDAVVRPVDDRYKQLGVRVLPDTFVVGRDGRGRARIRGARDWQAAEATRFLANMLEKAP